MNLDLLKQLLAIPTASRREERMFAFLVHHIFGRKSVLWDDCVLDQWNNLLIRKGDGCVPCVAAHIDTVHPLRPVEIVEQDGILVGFDERGQRTGIGADDKAGIFVCLELWERCDNIAVAFFGSEELGCVGARHAPAAWFKNVGYAIEFDAPGAGLVSYSSGGERLFANDGEFIQTAAPVLKPTG